MKHSSTSPPCPACGSAAGGGRFCIHCGAEVGERPCPRCGAKVPPGARFCAGCGAAVAGAVRPPGADRRIPVAPLVVGGVAVIALVFAFVVRGERIGTAGPAPAAALTGGGGGPPDLSQMTPRQAFTRLYERVMTAAERGDTATVAQFSPMALQAYANLDQIDADARFDVALIRLHIGDLSGAQALADSILRDQPSHLFGLVLGASIAGFEGDEAKRRGYYRQMLAAWDAEMRIGRPEYEMHQTMLDRVREDARAAAPAQ